MKVLHLTLKKKWFDMILSGEKTEEYREYKQYFISRLKNWKYDYDCIEFRNGYGKNAPMMRVELKDVCYGKGHEKWGAKEGENYLVIKLGKVIETNNL
jgi:uncharacterized protein (DUF736 family)